ncbi:hypothetical protein C5F48_05920 [Cereibacter changlensis JA139]|uniref:HTH DNA binding domain-containing protein n=2 Tax=Cereibacter changlensis TaxID=402884 RepID=A0A2T4JXM3_9RHOB|nr:helix-turn-helix domain-containing protein [Cereibacter changlensis]PTE22668.1 hypothetical protein C5F48_05920 [Cereibacter changlensis JA139]PZX58951.1 DNA binding protein with HTH domain [Cereibacter changlensis]
MKRPHADAELTPPSPYDADPEAEEDLWFLPEPDEEVAQAPLPRADRRSLLRPAEWRAAEAALAPDLARAAYRFGALDERLRRAAEGPRSRLALVEAAEFSWWAGDRVTPDRLALWLALRLDGVQDDSLALARAGWAVRRLTSGPGPQAGLAAFLGRQEAGQDWLADWSEIETASLGMHPITRAALGFHAWGLLTAPAASTRIEAAVVASRLAAAEGRGAVFLPLATGGSQALRPGGPAEDRLARWYAGAVQAAFAALRLLDRLDDWQARAAAATAGLSGRTPPLLIAALAHWPLLSAPVAEAETKASRAAVQRNLDRLTELGLIREVTGQGRFRLWSAAL